MAPKSSHIAQKFAPNLAGMMRYAIDASIAVRGWEYTDAAMSRDMSDITVGAGVRGRITATSITRLCGWDIPNHNEGELLNGAAGLVEGMVNIYMAAAPNLNNLNAPSTTHV